VGVLPWRGNRSDADDWVHVAEWGLKRHRAAWNDDFLAQLLGLRPVESVQSPAQKPGGG